MFLNSPYFYLAFPSKFRELENFGFEGWGGVGWGRVDKTKLLLTGERSFACALPLSNYA